MKDQKIKKVSISEKLNLFKDHWNPRIIGELSGQQVKLVKAKGAFDWHKHDHEDELFFVIRGEFDMQLRNEVINVKAGEFIIIPRGIEHRPVAKKEVHIMLFEPASTLNTGDNQDSQLTKESLEWI